MGNIHFIDLDKELLYNDAKLVVISKDEPQKVIMKIDAYYESMLKSYYKEYDLKIEYNGEVYYLSPEIHEQIKFKKKNIKLSKIGISKREFDTKSNIDRIYFILDKMKLTDEDKVVLISSNTENRKILIDVKEKISSKIKNDVFKVYLIDVLKYQTNDFIAKKKASIVLEYLIGNKIVSNKFSDRQQEEFNTAYYYDVDQVDINILNNIQSVFEVYLSNTDPIVKNEVINKLSKDKYLITNKITTNEMNPFNSSKVKIFKPSRIKMFERYNLY